MGEMKIETLEEGGTLIIIWIIIDFIAVTMLL